MDKSDGHAALAYSTRYSFYGVVAYVSGAESSSTGSNHGRRNKSSQVTTAGLDRRLKAFLRSCFLLNADGPILPESAHLRIPALPRRTLVPAHEETGPNIRAYRHQLRIVGNAEVNRPVRRRFGLRAACNHRCEITGAKFRTDLLNH
jgi:hypothetical protein